MNLTNYIIPVIIFLIILFGLIKKQNVYECFVEGAKDGMETVVRIVPPLVGLLVAISMLRSSGALDIIIGFISPVTSLIGIPKEIVPLALMRPISGSGSLALLSDILKTNGADSFAGNSASVMMGSTETTFYTLTVYFAATKIKNTRYALPAALISDLAGIIASVIICRLLYY